MPHVNKKPLARNGILVHKKLRLERTMNGLGTSFRKNSHPKNEKTVKIKVNCRMCTKHHVIWS